MVVGILLVVRCVLLLSIFFSLSGMNNANLIALIPKFLRIEDIKDFRPIIDVANFKFQVEDYFQNS